MKRIIEHAWRGPADEKIPLSSKKHGVDNGAIVKNGFVRSPGKEKMADEKKVDNDASGPESESMSLPRKFAMFLSLNVIALYFAAFFWLIPCRILNCKSPHEWEVNLQNISISTNVEVSDLGYSGLIIFGHIGENTGVTSVTTSAGSVKWNVPLDFSPVRCHCNVIDVNGDGVFDCLIFGESYVLALNASNGYVFWTQEFDTIAPLITTINSCDNASSWIVLVVNRRFGEGFASRRHRGRIYMALLDSRNGTVMKYLPLHCNFFPKQLVPWESKTNVTRLALQCSYNNSTEVQIISEEQICGLFFGRSSLKIRTFSVMFSFGSSTAVDDVVLLPVSHVGLVVGWFTMVAIVTDARNPPRLLWQSKPGSIRSAIKFISGGHYTSRNSTQIAVVMHKNSSHVVKILDVADGTEAASVDLGSGALSSVQSVSRRDENLDSLMIVKEEAISSASNSTSDRTTETAFGEIATNVSNPVYLLDFLKEKNITEMPVDYKITAIAVKSGDCITIFLAASMSNQTSRISSQSFRNQNSKNTCSCR